MKAAVFLIPIVFLLIQCNCSINKEEVKSEILKTEKAFEKMTLERGIPEAFYFFADESAVIKRENDALIVGKENIKIYYGERDLKNATVTWTPDFINVSASGDMAYTYGKYVWRIKNSEGNITEYKGVFHTVWKRQKNNEWKYVWD